MAELVLYEEADGVATVTMNRPQRLHAMTDVFLKELLEALEQAADAPDVRVVVLRGSGKAFCAGGDLKEESAGEWAAAAESPPRPAISDGTCVPRSC